MIRVAYWPVLAHVSLLLVGFQAQGIASDGLKSLCLSNTVGFGQRSAVLWCGQDSCRAITFAHPNRGPARVGYRARAVDTALINRGRALIKDVLARADWRMKPGPGVLGIGLDTRSRLISLHPANSGNLRPLIAWRISVADSMGLDFEWSDSLAVGASDKGAGWVSIFLASGKTASAWFAKDAKLQLFGARTWNKGEMPNGPGVERLDTLPTPCIEQVTSGGRCDHRVPKGMKWVQAELKGSPSDTNQALRNSCLEGRFELRAEWLKVHGK